MQIEDEAAQKEDELRAVAQMRCPETLLPPRAGFTTARVRRYRSLSSSVHAEGRAGEIQLLNDTAQQEVEKWQRNLERVT